MAHHVTDSCRCVSDLQGEGLGLHDSLQDHKAVRGHVDVAAVLDLVPHVWIHPLMPKHRRREGKKGESL